MHALLVCLTDQYPGELKPRKLRFTLDFSGAINPARDLGPRIFVNLVQSSDVGFQDMFWLIPTIGPLIGGVFGALTYLIFISAHHDTQSSPQKIINDDE